MDGNIISSAHKEGIMLDLRSCYYVIKEGRFFNEYDQEIEPSELKSSEKARLIKWAFEGRKPSTRELYLEITGVPSSRYLKRG